MRLHLQIAFLTLLFSGCSTLSGARPLAPGNHEIGATLGGPFVDLGAPIPIPSIVVGARSGVAAPLDRPLDLHYGLNLTAIPFGMLQGHIGAGWLLAHQKGAVPAVSFTDRVFFATNLIGLPFKTDKKFGFQANNQFEFALSWLFGEQLLHVSLSEYLDFEAPELTLTPAVGAIFSPMPGKGLRIHTEVRWFAVNQPHPLNTVNWLPGGSGALGASVGVSHVF